MNIIRSLCKRTLIYCTSRHTTLCFQGRKYNNVHFAEKSANEFSGISPSEILRLKLAYLFCAEPVGESRGNASSRRGSRVIFFNCLYKNCVSCFVSSFVNRPENVGGCRCRKMRSRLSSDFIKDLIWRNAHLYEYSITPQFCLFHFRVAFALNLWVLWQVNKRSITAWNLN